MYLYANGNGVSKDVGPGTWRFVAGDEFSTDNDKASPAINFAVVARDDAKPAK